jgi:hypothetical protein
VANCSVTCARACTSGLESVTTLLPYVLWPLSSSFRMCFKLLPPRKRCDDASRLCPAAGTRQGGRGRRGGSPIAIQRGSGRAERREWAARETVTSQHATGAWDSTLVTECRLDPPQRPASVLGANARAEAAARRARACVPSPRRATHHQQQIHSAQGCASQPSTQRGARRAHDGGACACTALRRAREHSVARWMGAISPSCLARRRPRPAQPTETSTSCCTCTPIAPIASPTAPAVERARASSRGAVGGTPSKRCTAASTAAADGGAGGGRVRLSTEPTGGPSIGRSVAAYVEARSAR